jgi:hypothetical protein
MTVEWLKENMSGWELSGWIEFFKLESEERDGKKRPTKENMKAAFGGNVKKRERKAKGKDKGKC